MYLTRKQIKVFVETCEDFLRKLKSNKLVFYLQISFFSTSPELSNKQRFEYFSRTIPSDHYQTMAMTKIVEELGWKYMSIIYEESNYGIKVNFLIFCQLVI